jgi:hypothetical protein
MKMEGSEGDSRLVDDLRFVIIKGKIDWLLLLCLFLVFPWTITGLLCSSKTIIASVDHWRSWRLFESSLRSNCQQNSEAGQRWVEGETNLSSLPHEGSQRDAKCVAQ